MSDTQKTLAPGSIVSGDFTTANKAAKTYYHRHIGAGFIMPNGARIVFTGGLFRTSDPVIIAELDAVADKPGTMIYTDHDISVTEQKLDAQVAKEATVISNVPETGTQSII